MYKRRVSQYVGCVETIVTCKIDLILELAFSQYGLVEHMLTF